MTKTKIHSFIIPPVLAEEPGIPSGAERVVVTTQLEVVSPIPTLAQLGELTSRNIRRVPLLTEQSGHKKPTKEPNSTRIDRTTPTFQMVTKLSTHNSKKKRKKR